MIIQTIHKHRSLFSFLFFILDFFFFLQESNIHACININFLWILNINGIYIRQHEFFIVWCSKKSINNKMSEVVRAFFVVRCHRAVSSIMRVKSRTCCFHKIQVCVIR